MCLAIPGKVVNVEGDEPAFLAGKVDFGGIRKEIRFAFTPEVRPGDYVLVHAGFALRVVDEDEAEHNRLAMAELRRELALNESDTPESGTAESNTAESDTPPSEPT